MQRYQAQRMFLFGFHKKQVLDTSFCGIHLQNPVGVRLLPEARPLQAIKRTNAGFITLAPPKDHVLDWITGLQEYRDKTVLALNVSSDLARSFSLVYDFSDFIIIDPDGDNGIDSPDLSDTSVLLDEVVNLRLCYEHYTPIVLRLSHGHTPEEIQSLLDHCRISGIDGMVAPGPKKVRMIVEQTQGRFPVIGSAQSPEEALECFQAGASLVETSNMGSCTFSKLLHSLPQL